MCVCVCVYISFSLKHVLMFIRIVVVVTTQKLFPYLYFSAIRRISRRSFYNFQNENEMKAENTNSKILQQIRRPSEKLLVSFTFSREFSFLMSVVATPNEERRKIIAHIYIHLSRMTLSLCIFFYYSSRLK